VKLKIQNIGMIKKAEIDLSGITVIGGTNQTGKSTIGKLVWTYTNFKNKVFYHSLSKSFKLADLSNDFYVEIKKFYDNEPLHNYIDSIVNAKLENVIKFHVAFLTNNKEDCSKIIKENLDKILSGISLNTDEFKIFIHEKYENLKSECEKYINEINDDKHNKIIEYFKKSFNNDIISKINKKKSILTIDGYIIDFNNENIIYNSEGYSEGSEFMLTNITFKGSNNPIDFMNKLVSLKDNYNNGDFFYTGLFEDPIIYHQENLKRDIKNRIPLNDLDKKVSEIIELIHTTINGQLIHNETEDRYCYKDNNNFTYDLNNVSGGIKIFTFLEEILLKTNIKNKNIIIFDEPETNLHPEWQIFLSEIFVKLYEIGFKIMLITHSPYLIQAMKFYTKNIKSNEIHFYIANKEGNQSVLSDCTKNIDPLFKKLTLPLNSIM